MSTHHQLLPSNPSANTWHVLPTDPARYVYANRPIQRILSSSSDSPYSSRSISPASSISSVTSTSVSAPPNRSHPTTSKTEGTRKHSATPHVPRPLNPFFCFRKVWIKEQKAAGSIPDRLAQRHLSKLAGEAWAGMGEEERRPFVESAVEDKERHAKMYPGYRYRPRVRRGLRLGSDADVGGMSSSEGDDSSASVACAPSSTAPAPEAPLPPPSLFWKAHSMSGLTTGTGVARSNDLYHPSHFINSLPHPDHLPSHPTSSLQSQNTTPGFLQAPQFQYDPAAPACFYIPSQSYAHPESQPAGIVPLNYQVQTHTHSQTTTTSAANIPTQDMQSLSLNQSPGYNVRDLARAQSVKCEAGAFGRQIGGEQVLGISRRSVAASAASDRSGLTCARERRLSYSEAGFSFEDWLIPAALK